MSDQVDAATYAAQQAILYQVVLENRDGIHALLFGPFTSRHEAEAVLRSLLNERWLEFKRGHVKTYREHDVHSIFGSPIWIVSSRQGVPGGNYRPVEAD